MKEDGDGDVVSGTRTRSCLRDYLQICLKKDEEKWTWDVTSVPRPSPDDPIWPLRANGPARLEFPLSPNKRCCC